MTHDEVTLQQRAIYGFDHGFSAYPGWFSVLFEPSALYPSLNFIKKETRELLLKKSLFAGLVPIFAKHLKTTEIIKKLLGIDFALLDAKSKASGLVEELADALLKEAESRKTLESRMVERADTLSKGGLYFCGINYPINDRKFEGKDKPRFAAHTDSTEGSFVAIEAMLNHIDAIKQFNPALAKEFDGSGIEWLLSDFPYFSMNSANPLYKGNVVGVLLDKEFESNIQGKIPFKKEIGWYPYVIVFGNFRSALSTKYPTIKSIDWAWMRTRTPKPGDEVAPHLKTVLTDQKNAGNAYLPWINSSQAEELFLFLSAVQLIYSSRGLTLTDVRPDIRKLTDAVLTVTTEANIALPNPIGSFFS